MLGITVLAIWNLQIALLVLAFAFICLAYPAFRRIRRIFFAPFTSTDAVNDHRSQHWILRAKWRKLFRMQPIPGQLTRKEKSKPVAFTSDTERILREAINAENGNRIPPASNVMPMPRRYRRT
jgi:hypothetical protein